MDVFEDPSQVVRVLRKIPYLGFPLFRVYDKLLRTIAFRCQRKTAFNHLIRCDSRDMIQNRIMHFGTWEPEVSGVFREFVKPGDVVADVGANIGYFTLLAHSLVGTQGQIVAFEASMPVFLKLCENVSQNKLDKLKLWPVAVASEPGEATVYSAPISNVGMTTTVASRGFPASEQVKAFTLESLLTECERKRLSFMKIDIEGAEIPVLERVLASLQIFPALKHVLVEASIQDCPERWESVFQRFLSAGFEAREIKNCYEMKWYFDKRSAMNLAPLKTLPDRQTDILFSLR